MKIPLSQGEYSAVLATLLWGLNYPTKLTALAMASGLPAILIYCFVGGLQGNYLTILADTWLEFFYVILAGTRPFPLHCPGLVMKPGRVAGLSPFYFCRVFEKEMGVPPHIYQLDIRLTKAAQMLAKGKAIAAVASDTGFFDQSHFQKAFKRKFGITPRQYRQR